MISIDRDTNGTPHIYGADEPDVAFGFGYAQAYDHLDLMLRNYMEAVGRLSEIEGASAVETDFRTRLWRTVECADAAYPSLDAKTRTYIDAFVAGANRYIENNPQEVPAWGESVTPIQVIALYRLLHIRLNEWTMPELGPLADAGMSNQWAVAPERTQGNATICAMDPHVPWVPIFRMYEAHLCAADGLDIYGAAPYGLPTIILGHTARHAWSITINQCDVSDLYVEQMDANNPRLYQYQDQWRKTDEYETTIQVKENGRLVPQSRILSWSHHGPIVARDGDKSYALRMSAYEIDDPVTPFLNLARAQDLTDFKNALVKLEIPMFNFVYGDAKGELYYVYNERCPVRSEDYDWRQPVTGWTHRTEWQMYLPFNHLPQIENPPSGFLQNCNNSPWYVTQGDPVSVTDFPAYAAFEETNGRAERIYSWLVENDSVTIAQAQDMVLDEYNVTSQELKPALLDAWTAQALTLDDSDGLISDAIEILSEWNDVGAAASPGMSVFSLWKMRYDDLVSSEDSGSPELMIDALRSTVQYMKEHYGTISVPWGEIHVLQRGEKSFPVGGSSHGTESVRPVRGSLNDEGRIVADFGSAFTMVVELGTEPTAWSLVPYGNSERPDSVHYDDQGPLWSERRLKRAWFSKQDVLDNLETHEELER
jgi:acyl-homoserine-lactone acylase